jgi:hypothetical protein
VERGLDANDLALLGWQNVRHRAYDEAVGCFVLALALRRGSPWWSLEGVPLPPERHSAIVNVLKLDHDIEQFSYLLKNGPLPDRLVGVVGEYEALRRELAATYGEGATIELRRGLYPGFDATYGRILRWRDTPRLPGPALGTSWNRSQAAADYARPPGLCWVDGLLGPATLAELRAFCLESTIWNDHAHSFTTGDVVRGYLGTYAGDGFCCPLLFQIADELARALPSVFADRPLRQMWAYKYKHSLSGIAAHGDDAAVNVNFWITPDAANLDPDGGGLLVYPVEAPADWRFEDINKDEAKIAGFLAGSGVAPVSVPYRENRAVIFNSDLFHATAPLRFRPGYENRRINVTMLFGERGK